MSMYCDAHIHVQHDNERVDEFLDDIFVKNITPMLCNGTSPQDWRGVSHVAEHCDRIIPFYGLHPWYVDDVSSSWEMTLRALLAAHPHAGVGEIGLDKTRRGGAFERQKKVFSAQLAIAREYQRPVCVHCVNAWGMLTDVLHDATEEVSIMIHWFGGSAEIADRLIRQGAFISLSVSTPDEKLKEYLARIPRDRLLLETDWPYQKTDHDGYGACVCDVYQRVARILSLDETELQKQVQKNVSIFTNRAAFG